MRRKLKNKDFTFLTPNCLGGILLHDLGLQFLTPTINLMMTQGDFLKFVSNLDEYINSDLEFLPPNKHDCPCACIRPSGQPEITIYFTHYKTAEEARIKWVERSARINKDNLFVFLEERDGITRKDLECLKELQVKGIVVFTCNRYPDLPFCVYIDKYHEQGEVGNILKKNLIDDSREYEKIFDFVKWFNEAKGSNYDVKGYTKL